MTKPLKVLMMGGRRCGKTSALASIFAEMKNGPVKRYFTVSDRTVLETKGLETQDSLNDKTLELQYMLEQNKDNSNIFLVDKNPTYYIWDYNLHLQIPGTKQEMDMEFRDAAGEFFERNNSYSTEMTEFMKECDVFVIVIDTPYLMGPVDESTRELCPESINLGTNCINDIQQYLTYIDDNKGTDAKMVVFVPLKCEKWAKEPNGLNRVTERVKQVFDTHITNLKAFNKMSISIIPMLTCGNILFSEFRKAYVYNSIEGPVRCCKIDEEIIRNENGENEPLMPGESVIEDPQAVIAGTTLLRPYSWYQINPQDNGFAPHNCDQLPLHIIRFMLSKLIDAEVQVKHEGILGSVFDFLKSIINKISEVFGTIDPEKLKQIIAAMQKDGIIKNNGCGIEIIKNF